MKFEITDIDNKDWAALDFVLEHVEVDCPEKEKEILLNNEIFLHMLSAVKFDVNNYMKIPHFIRESKICKKYCQQVNPNVIELLNNGSKLSKIDIYKKYLGI